jgi:diguanylate cyclase (GGDEF)-like protein
VRRVRALHGASGVDQMLAAAGVDRDVAYLENTINWVWYEEALALLCAAAEITGDHNIARRVGEDTVRQHAGTTVATVLRSLGSPEAIFGALTATATKFSTVVDMAPVEVGPGRAVVRKTTRADFQRHRHCCDLTSGLLSQPPSLFGLPPAVVRETRCQLRGDDHCLYEVEWDASRAAETADPAQLVTALEAQISAMTDRLESMYATARDLVALSDVDTALARVLERVAGEIRAPRHILVARASEGEPPHVHQHGYSDAEAEAIAPALLDGTFEIDTAESLVADVVSSGRRYGLLMSTSRHGSFFPQERDLLEVYASYAASILDTASALSEARLQHERSHALLQLSRALAAAITSDDVADRLVDVTPGLIDCDRVAVMLWSESERGLVVRAVGDPDPERHAAMMGQVIRPEDTPHIAAQLASPHPEPSFYRPDADDEHVRRTMAKLGISALAVVPIVGHNRFHGVLNVSVVARPERLRATPDLLDRLAGLAAQAATALDNARLIERMAHQAAHDNLTGLLGHRAFHEALEAAVEEGEVFALAALDLDDFKAINDTRGHPVGDAALRKVAEALTDNVREEDAVFRVGGEEFALLMPGVAAIDAVPIAERVRAAVAAIDFDPPLRVSIGLAGYPDDASGRDGLIERADVALYAAKRTGKDRTTVVSA